MVLFYSRGDNHPSPMTDRNYYYCIPYRTYVALNNQKILSIRFQGSWSGLGTLPPNLARGRLNPAQSPLVERGGIDGCRDRQVGFDAPEIGNDAARGGGGGASGGDGGVNGAKRPGGSAAAGGGATRSRIGKGRGMMGSSGGGGVGERGDVSVALPVLEDVGGAGVRSGRQEEWVGAGASPSPGLFGSRAVPVAGRGQA